MKSAILVSLVCALGLAILQAAGDPQALKFNATVVSGTSLRLDWEGIGQSPATQKIRRRVQGSANTWGTELVSLSNPAVTTYTDNTVVPGVLYEYQLGQAFAFGNYFPEAWGYVSAGIRVPAVEYRGKLLLLIDQSQASALEPEIAQLEQDLTGDGWTVIRHDLPRETVDASALYTPQVGAARLAEVTAVKAVILDAYNTDPANLKQVYILGHLPIPYAGDGIADGHLDHEGAVPSDTYYGDVTGVWTDSTANKLPPRAGTNRNINVPGDGKFDNSSIPGEIRLGVGRVDLFDMTQFPNSSVGETELLRRYLRKAHDYRHKKGSYAAIERRALIFPWSGGMGGLALGALTGIYSGVGSSANNYDIPDSSVATWFSWQQANPAKTYLMGVGQGGGGYEGAGTVGSSLDFGTRPSRVVFPSLFGSYFGDWGSPNNFLRAPLAGSATGDSLGLCSYWNGYPNWYSHQMAMGETLGSMMVLSANNYYTAGSGGDVIMNFQPGGQTSKGNWMGLMGDPALRWYSVLPPQNLQAQSSGGSVTLSWSASSESGVLGYVVYRAASPAGPFNKLTTTPITSPLFTDASGSPGTAFTYMVRTLKLEQTPSGSFENLSQGIFATLSVNGGGVSIPPKPTGLLATIRNSNAIDLTWTGDSASGYRVERRAGGAGSFSTLATLGAAATAYTDAGPLTPGTTFYYRVLATGTAGDSLPSEEVSVDGAAGFIEMVSSILHVPNSAGFVDIVVRRYGGTTGGATVQYATSNGSAVAGTHYTGTSGTLTWADGESGVKTVRISVTDLAQPQLPRSCKLSLSNPSGATLAGSSLSALVLIEDPAAALGTPWQSKILGSVMGDFGAVGQVGGEIGSIIAGGNESMGRFIYQPITGDKTMVVKIEAPSPTLGWGGIFSSGIMVREEMNNPYGRLVQFLIGETPATGSRLGSYDQYYDSSPVFIPNAQTRLPANTLSGPLWVRLTRSGDTFTAETSPDGASWTLFGSVTCAGLPATASWCLFHSNPGYPYLADLQLVRFNNVQFSAPVLPTPNVPTALTASAVSTGLRLAWSHVTSFESGFKLERRVEGTADFVQIATTSAKLFTDTTVAGDSVYEYRVRAYNASSNSGFSHLASAATPVVNIVLSITTATGQGADATIRNGVNANTNYGGAPTLFQENATPSFAKSYLRFDLSGRPPKTRVTQAVMKLTTAATLTELNGIDALPDSADAWNEATITWNNAPSHDSAGSGFAGGKRLWFTFLGSPIAAGVVAPFSQNTPFPSSAEDPGYYGFWLAPDYLEAQIGNNGLLTFGLSRDSEAGATFASRENVSYAKPTLAITLASLLPTRASNLTGSVSAPGSIQLQWKDNSTPDANGYNGETGFRVEVSTNGGANYTPLATIRVNATSFTTSSLPPIIGNHLYRVVALNAVGDATPSLPVNLAPFAGLTEIQSWMFSNNLPLDGTGSGSMTASPAGDGIMNLMKYALGINAGTAGYQGRMSSGTVNVGGSNYLSYTYTRPEPAPAGVTYLPESCADMTAWSGGGVVEVSSSLSGGLRTITVRDSTAINAATRRFLRLKVTIP